ncbi:MAG: hypothetical protein BGO29_06820 [Bacteroidales bacterium 36-12]|nr:MAG: hypothetical protein BGO29_06820 [Bacteroidales bacterium 36-12]
MIIPQEVNTLVFDLGGVIYNIDIQLGIDNFKKIGFVDADKYISNFSHNDFFVGWESGKVGHVLDFLLQ